MLDYTNVTEVKDFILNILTENHELRQTSQQTIEYKYVHDYENESKLVRAANLVADILDDMKALNICPQYYRRLEKVIEVLDEVVQE